MTTGNVTPITALEVDQGRLTASGKPQDADDAGNFRPRSYPGGRRRAAFAGFLRSDGIRLHGGAGGRGGRAAASPVAASVPAAAAIVEQMLTESNNVIAENLARQVAIATGRPASFSGAATADTAVRQARRPQGIHLVDGSGLSPVDRITADPGAAGQAGGSARPAGAARHHHRHAGGGILRHPGPGRACSATSAARARRGAGQDGQPDGRGLLAGVAYARGQLLAFAFMADRLPTAGCGRPPDGLTASPPP